MAETLCARTHIVNPLGNRETAVPHCNRLCQAAFKRRLRRSAAITIMCAAALLSSHSAHAAAAGSTAPPPDASAGENEVEAWLRSIETLRWRALPFRWALTTTRGSGRRQIAVFSDPNCAYCRRFEAELAGIDDLTVHIFMYPVISPKSVQQSKAVWCLPARERAKAWHALVQQGRQPAAAPACANPVDQLVELGHKYNVKMTPTWILPNDERYQGALPARDLLPLLDRAVR